LLDLHMPGMSGFEVLGALFHEQSSVPVIVITAKDEAGTAERVRDQGAAGYLKKPVDEVPLLEAVVKAIGEPAQGVA
jgi:FixJ family two-component response regulator